MYPTPTMDNPSAPSSTRLTPVTDASGESPAQLEAGRRGIEEMTRKSIEECRIQDDDTSKARGYEVSEMESVPLNPHEIPTDNPSAIYTTQPMGSSYPVECLLHSAAAKRELVEFPGYPLEIHRPSEVEERSYTIVDIPGKGLGMVATQDIEQGDLIASERPLLLAPHGMCGFRDIWFEYEATQEEQQAAMFSEVERVLRVAYDRMRPDDQAAYMKLHNAHLDDGSGPLLGILRTNVYSLFDMQGSKYTGVFNELSRINHSCCPNADRTFHRASLSMRLYAVRDIQKGEEITTSYCDLLAPFAKRQQYLARYGIHCECPPCLYPVESDENRRRISRLKNAVPAIIKWAATPALRDDLLIVPALTILRLLVGEGLEATQHYTQALYHTMLIFAALGTEGDKIGYLCCIEEWARLRRWDAEGRNPAEKAKCDLEKVKVASRARRLLAAREGEGVVVDTPEVE
ncbi:hypothetical protein EYR40_009375 [Pleurotus pulmonarius]|nr:hypothetical protein EYR40_009375 [Pleurotus pulmonarius]